MTHKFSMQFVSSMMRIFDGVIEASESPSKRSFSELYSDHPKVSRPIPSNVLVRRALILLAIQHVLLRRTYTKILTPVVETVPVNMVNILGTKKIPTKHASKYQAMQRMASTWTSATRISRIAIRQANITSCYLSPSKLIKKARVNFINFGEFLAFSANQYFHGGNLAQVGRGTQ